MSKKRSIDGQAVVFRTISGEIIWSPLLEGDDTLIKKHQAEGDTVLVVTSTIKAREMVKKAEDKSDHLLQYFRK